jgi:hypothetical protein
LDGRRDGLLLGALDDGCSEGCLLVDPDGLTDEREGRTEGSEEGKGDGQVEGMLLLGASEGALEEELGLTEYMVGFEVSSGMSPSGLVVLSEGLGVSTRPPKSSSVSLLGTGEVDGVPLGCKERVGVDVGRTDRDGIAVGRFDKDGLRLGCVEGALEGIADIVGA